MYLSSDPASILSGRAGFVAGLLLLGLLTTLVYWPGLSGGFLLDDFYNLAPLGQHGGVHSWEAVRNFVFGNGSGVLGRPLSMASFLLDARDWPADPFPFKRTGLWLHLLCGAWWALCAVRLLRLAGVPAARLGLIALLAGALWLWHPLQVSTVLYVVQRMTMLSSLFILVGLWVYLYGRCAGAVRPWQNLLWMAAGLGIGMVGVLAKENAVLIAAYALVIEWVWADRLPRDRHLAWPARAMAVAPLLAVAIYAVHSLVPMAGHIEAVRGWSIGERLLTEPRVLADYLGQIFWPRIGQMGLAHDDWTASHSLWEPATGLAILGGLGLLVLAVWARRRLPLLAFAILWFLAGHAMEGSVFPLELYFEHRNYLPLAGPALLVACCIAGGMEWLAQRHWPVIARGVLMGAVPLVLLLQTYALTGLWGNNWLLQASWLSQHPTSLRARSTLAGALDGIGDREAAYRILGEGFRTMPDNNLELGIRALSLACRAGLAPDPDARTVLQDGRMREVGFGVYNALSELARVRSQHHCDAVVTDAQLEQLFTRIATDPRLQSSRVFLQRLYFDFADLYVARGDLGDTVRCLEEAYRALPSLDVALRMSVIWLSAGQYEQAWRWIQVAQYHDAHRKVFTASRAAELSNLARSIESAMQAQHMPLPQDDGSHRPPYVFLGKPAPAAE